MTKCLVKDCQNYDDQGEGIYMDCYFSQTSATRGRLFPKWICMPCFNFIITMDGTNSQIYRNALIVNKENEKCEQGKRKM